MAEQVTLLLSKLATLVLIPLTKYRIITMSEPRSAHDIILASIKAEEEGVTVNWKQTLLQYHDAAMQEIKRLNDELERSQEACANLKLIDETASSDPM